MEESQELEKLPRVVTGVLKVVLSFSLIALAVVLIIALAKITYTLAIMVFNTSSVVPYDVAEQAVMFFLYFGFIGLIVQYFKSGYHFPLRYFIYAGITAMLRLIIVNHESSVDTILFAGAILIMVIALCLVLYSNKLKFKSAVILTEVWNGLFRYNPFHCPTSRTFRDERLGQIRQNRFHLLF